MSNKIVFVSSNLGKIKEVKDLLSESMYELITLQDIDFKDKIEEPFETFEENSLHKANTIYQKYGLDCFSDDSGLMVNHLKGAPGVYSARFAGSQATDQDNMDKLLRELNDSSDRKAQFVTVISLIYKGKIVQFRGEITGEITKEQNGENGFGYDPIFIPCGSEMTFGEMNRQEKASFSHRAAAMNKLKLFLNEKH